LEQTGQTKSKDYGEQTSSQTTKLSMVWNSLIGRVNPKVKERWVEEVNHSGFGFFTRPRVVMETAAQAALEPRVFCISRLQS
jgi:hypothetical protein